MIMEGTENQQMFFSKLPEALDTLCSLPHGLQDDTILHRLLDLIKQLVVTSEDITASGLLTFLKKATEEIQDIHASVLVLALGTAAHLVSMTTAGSDAWKVSTDLFDAVQLSRTLGNSSVAAGYFNNLAKLLDSNQAGTEWLEQHSVHVQTALDTMETARSVFVLNAIENFLVTVVTHSLDTDSANVPEEQSASVPEDQSADEPEDQSAASPKSVSLTLEYLDIVLADMTKQKSGLMDQIVASSNSHMLHLTAVQVIKRLSDSKRFCQRRLQDDKFVQMLVRLTLHHPTDKIRQSALKSLINICACMDTAAQMKLLSESLWPALLTMIAGGEVERGVNIAAGFCDSLSDCHSATVPMLYLKAVRRLPHDVMFSKDPAYPDLAGLVPMVTTALCNRQTLARLTGSILHTLKQTQNSSGLSQLLQSVSAVREDPEWLAYQSKWPQPLGAAITGNGRLLNSLLQFLQEPASLGLQASDAVFMLNSLLNIMGRPQVDTRHFSQASEAFLAIVKTQSEQGVIARGDEMDKTVERLMTLLERSLVSMQWEVRDSALEFICKLITVAHDDQRFQALMTEHHILRQAWSCIQDGESYPRASTIALAVSLHRTPGWWQVFLKDCGTSEVAVVDQMIELLTAPESLPSRAPSPPAGPSCREAVQLLSAIYHHSVSTNSNAASTEPQEAQLRKVICSTLLTALKDADWEVKVKALEFWEKIADSVLKDLADGTCSEEQVASAQFFKSSDSCFIDGNELASSAKTDNSKCSSHKHKQTDGIDSIENRESLASLLSSGLEEALFIGVEDYDSSVRQKAFEILSKFQRNFCSAAHSPTKKLKTVRKVEQNGRGDGHDEEKMENAKKKDAGESEEGNEMETEPENGAENARENSHSPSSPRTPCGHANSMATGGSVTLKANTSYTSSELVKKFVARVESYNPLQKLQETAVSVDEYDRRPISLLEDMIASAKMVTASAEAALTSEDEFDDGEDIFVDCY